MSFRTILSTTVLLSMLLNGMSAQATTLLAKVDRSVLTANETLTLTLRLGDGDSDTEPDFTPLERDFEVLGTNRNSKFMLRNGRRESWVEWIVSLAPRRAGRLQIPVLQIGDQRSAAIPISVAEAKPASAAAGSQVFLEVEADQQEVYVQSQLLVTVRVYHAVNFNRGASLTDLEIADAVIRPLAEQSYAKVINGVRYGVFERRYAVFPEHSGELLISPLTFQANVSANRNSWFDSFGSGRTLRARSTEQRVRVLPRADGFRTGDWLPASGLRIVETWDRPPEEMRVGDSATRTLSIEADGLLGALLPPLPEISIKGLKVYPDQAAISEQESESGFTGRRIETSAVVPVLAGTYELPELRIAWWNTDLKKRQEALIPARSIIVLPAFTNSVDAPAQSLPAPTMAAPDPVELGFNVTPSGEGATPLSWWAALCLLLALAWLFSSWQWWRLHRHLAALPVTGKPGANDSGEQALYRELLRACSANDSQLASRLLPRWLAAHWQLPTSGSLQRCLEQSDDAGLDEAVIALQVHCYGAGSTGDWRGEALADSLRRLHSQRSEWISQSRSQELPSLYARPA